MSVKFAARARLRLVRQIFAGMALKVGLIGVDHALNFVRVGRLG